MWSLETCEWGFGLGSLRGGLRIELRAFAGGAGSGNLGLHGGVANVHPEKDGQDPPDTTRREVANRWRCG